MIAGKMIAYLKRNVRFKALEYNSIIQDLSKESSGRIT